MHPGFSIPAGIQPQPEPHYILPANYSMNQTLILDQIHNIPLTQQLLLQGRPHHHHSSSDYFPVNFKLGLMNEICSTNIGDEEQEVTNVVVNGHEGAVFLRGSQQYEDPDARYCCLKLPDCWQNQEDSAVKHWELVTAEAYENSERTVERLESLIAYSLNQKENPTTCLESKRCRQLFGPTEILPMGLDDGSEASISQEASISAFLSKKKSRRKKRHYIAQFFEKLMKQVMDHQENLERKLTEVIERLDEERRERDEAWRNRELAHFQEEAAARAREKAMAASREATIISYLEKISGQRIHLPLSDDQLVYLNQWDGLTQYGSI